MPTSSSLDWTLTRHDELLDLTRPLTFIGNHDVTCITTLVGPQGAVLAMAVLCTVGGCPRSITVTRAVSRGRSTSGRAAMTRSALNCPPALTSGGRRCRGCWTNTAR